MNGLMAVFLLLLTTALHLVAFVGARRVAAGAFATDKRLSLPFFLARGGAGVVAWYFAGSVLFAGGLLARGETVVDDASMRVRVSPDGPAARAGVKDGDRILRVEGEAIRSWDQLKSVVAKRDVSAVEIARGDETIVLSVTPEGSPPRIRVAPWTEERSVSLGRAVTEGLVQPGKIVASTIRAFTNMLLGTERPEVSGATGIVKETSTAAQHGFVTGLLLATGITSYMLPLVLLGSAIYELFTRRHEIARVRRLADR